MPNSHIKPGGGERVQNRHKSLRTDEWESVTQDCILFWMRTAFIGRRPRSAMLQTGAVNIQLGAPAPKRPALVIGVTASGSTKLVGADAVESAGMLDGRGILEAIHARFHFRGKLRQGYPPLAKLFARFDAVSRVRATCETEAEPAG